MEVKSGYKHTEVGIIPDEWDVCSIGQIFTLVNGCAFRPEDWKQTGNPIIRIQNLNDPSADYNYSQAPVPERNRIDPGDLLFAWSGTIGTSFGARVWAGPSGVLNQHIFKVHINEDRITLPFSLLVFARVEEDIAKRAHGFKASFVHVKKSDLVQVSIPVPPLSEQRAIATALSDVNALLLELDRLIAKKRDLKQAAMQQLLTGRTRLRGFSGEWRNAMLGQVISRFSTGLNPRENFRLNSGGTFFYVTIKNFSNGRLKLDDQCDLIDADAFRLINQRADLKKDDILFASIGRVGDAYLITDTPRNWNINESVFTLRPDKEKILPLMLFYLLTNKSVKDALGQGVTGSTFKSIKQADLKAVPCRFPVSHAEQAAIAEVLSDMDAELAAQEARRDKTLALKQGMMQELLIGKTRLVHAGAAHA